MGESKILGGAHPDANVVETLGFGLIRAFQGGCISGSGGGHPGVDVGETHGVGLDMGLPK